MSVNISQEMRSLELSAEERELLEFSAMAYDTLVEAREDPTKRGRGFDDAVMKAARELAARFHRGTIRAVAPRSFTQCLECGAELAGGAVEMESGADGLPTDVVKSTPTSRHLDDSLCAFYVLSRVHRARTGLGL